MSTTNSFGFPIINDDTLATATTTNLSTSAAIQSYVLAVAAGVIFQPSVVCACTGNLNATYANGAAGVGATLTNATTQAAFSADGVSPSATNRVLVQFQTDATQNGIYTLTTVGSGATNWVLTRATDYDQVSEINPGDFVPVRQGGTLYGGTSWREIDTVTAIGTDPINFAQTSFSIPVKLASGGTSANLTANNGGIFYSTASAGAILSGTATATQMLQSGSSSAPAWSTTTWPATSTVNQLLYSSSANTVAGLATANNGVLITSAGGVPSISSTLPSAVQGNITSVGTIASGTWHGTVIAGTYGGTGINNGASTFTIGGNTSFVGAHTFAGTLTGNTAVTFPTSGTLATTTANVGTTVLQTFTSSGTYTPTANMLYCVVYVTAGGGGGGGASVSGSSGPGVSCGGGGGSGSTSWKVFSAIDIGVSQTVTVGAGGVGGNPGASGGTGGNSIFGSVITTHGGTGGLNCSGTATAGSIILNTAGGAGGIVGTGGSINVPGSPGSPGFATTISSTSPGLSGNGAASYYQGGGLSVAPSSAGNAGNIGGAYGAGGSGAAANINSGQIGGAGGGGIITILEFIVS